MIRTSLLLFKKKPKPGEQASLERKLLETAGNSLFEVIPTSGMFPTLTRRFSSSTIGNNAGGLGSVMRSEVESKIISITKAFLKDIKHSKPNRLTPTATFSSLGLDSLDSIDLVIEYEERLNIDLSNEDAERRIKSVADAVSVFTEYSQNRPRPRV